MALGQKKCANAAIEVDTMKTAAQSRLAHGRPKWCHHKEEVNDHGLLGAFYGALSAEEAASSGLNGEQLAVPALASEEEGCSGVVA